MNWFSFRSVVFFKRGSEAPPPNTTSLCQSIKVKIPIGGCLQEAVMSPRCYWSVWFPLHVSTLALVHVWVDRRRDILTTVRHPAAFCNYSKYGRHYIISECVQCQWKASKYINTSITKLKGIKWACLIHVFRIRNVYIYIYNTSVFVKLYQLQLPSYTSCFSNMALSMSKNVS